MASENVDVAYEFLPLIRVYKDGRVERLLGTGVVPPSVDPQTGVASKDVTIVPETGVSARIFIPNPNITNPQSHPKLPVVVYYHGGGFCNESPFSPTYHSYINSLVAEAKAVVVSVHYRRAPEHPLPTAYDDSWAAFQWVASHAEGEGPEAWLTDHADFGRIFFAGDSAGANIAHNMAVRFGSSESVVGGKVKLLGLALVHPFFGGEEEAVSANASEIDLPKKAADKFWSFVFPSSTVQDDPLINPGASPTSLSRLGCDRVLVFVAEKDFLKGRGRFYYEKLSKSGWGGVAEIVETEGEGHVFHLGNPTCDEARKMMERMTSFLNGPVVVTID